MATLIPDLMVPIVDFTELASGVLWWQGYEDAVRCDLTSTALLLGEQLVLIDPVALEEAALQRMILGRMPTAILLTNGNHQRDSLALRDRLGVPIFAPEGAGLVFDFPLTELSERFPELRAIPLPGAGPGEHAIFRQSPAGVLVFGDAVVHLPPEGLRPLPEKYCEDPELSKSSLLALRDVPADTLCFAHGSPIFSEAKPGLTALIDALF